MDYADTPSWPSVGRPGTLRRQSHAIFIKIDPDLTLIPVPFSPKGEGVDRILRANSIFATRWRLTAQSEDELLARCTKRRATTFGGAKTWGDGAPGHLPIWNLLYAMYDETAGATNSSSARSIITATPGGVSSRPAWPNRSLPSSRTLQSLR